MIQNMVKFYQLPDSEKREIQRKMRKYKNRIGIVLAGAMIVTCLTGCGSGDGNVSSAGAAGTAMTAGESGSASDGSNQADSGSLSDSSVVATPGQRVYAPDDSEFSDDEDSAESASSSNSSAAKSGTTSSQSSATGVSRQKISDGDAEGVSVAFLVRNPKAKDVDTEYVYGYPRSEQDIEGRLKTMAAYWEEGNLDAIDDIMRMGDMIYVSQQLNGTANYYYYGEQNDDGTPNGTGIAIYADNSYYYGSFDEGIRSGDGMWVRIYVDGGTFSKANNGIYFHSYQGTWANDLPNGDGQEHVDCNIDYQEYRVAMNVIGSFKNGYYDGDEYVTTLDADGTYTDWTGTADNGVWKAATDSYDKTKYSILPVCVNEKDDENYIWIRGAVNEKQGITGLVEGPSDPDLGKH
jgi:hypothetical protein